MTGEPRRYADARAFRRALEDRLKRRSADERLDLQRLLRGVAFDRFLARLFAREDAPWVLKGGYAMELRFKEARATKDLDLALREAFGKKVHETLAEAAARDLGDFFVFLVGAAMRDLDAAPSGGARYPVEARLDDRAFVKFHLDVGAGDVVLAPLDVTRAHDWLEFARIPGASFPTVSREQQFAEKLHAYTLPRKGSNTRVRDLADMLLLLRSGAMDPARVRKALSATFERRGTHPLPAVLEPPPRAWEEPFARLAEECRLSAGLDGAVRELSAYFSALP